MAHLLDHDPRQRGTIVVSGRGFKQMALLLATGEFGVALIDDHIQQRIAHVLRRNLAQCLPLGTAFIMAELDLIGIDSTEERLEFEIIDLTLIYANLFAPFIEKTNPITKCSNFEYFS